MDRAVHHDARRADGGDRRLDRPHRAARHLPRYPPRPVAPVEHVLPVVDDPGLSHRHERVGREPGQTRRPLRPGAHVQPRLRRLHLLLAPAEHHLDDRHGRRDLVDRDAHLPRRRRSAPLGELGRHPHRRLPARPSRASPSGSTRRRPSAGPSSACCSEACWPR